jgi:hypothetical protein
VGPDPPRVRNGNRKGDTYRRDRTLLVRQGCGCPGSDGRARAISASQARRGEHAGYRRCGGSGWSRRVVFGRGLGGPGAADPCDERYRVPARIGVEDPHVRRDHGARGGRADRSGHGYQHVPAVRGPHPSRPRRPDHDAESPDAHVGDPRSLAGMGHALVRTHALLPWRLADLARGLLPLLLRPRWDQVPAPRELLRASAEIGYAYSNLAVALAGFVAEATSGADFDELCRQRVFAPLG